MLVQFGTGTAAQAEAGKKGGERAKELGAGIMADPSGACGSCATQACRWLGRLAWTQNGGSRPSFKLKTASRTLAAVSPCPQAMGRRAASLAAAARLNEPVTCVAVYPIGGDPAATRKWALVISALC